jgi:hypothetical protein
VPRKKLIAISAVVALVGVGVAGSAALAGNDRGSEPRMNPSDANRPALPANGRVPVVDAQGNLVVGPDGQPLTVVIPNGPPPVRPDQARDDVGEARSGVPEIVEATPADLFAGDGREG